MNDTGTLSRRAMLHRLGMMMGGAVAAPIAAGVLGGCRPRPVGTAFEPQVLVGDRTELVLALAERILPETDTPGARSARVDTFVDEMLAGWFAPEDRERLLAGLDAVDARARAAHGRPFAALDAAAQDAVVEALDREAFPEAYGGAPAPLGPPPPFFRTFKELTMVGYYTSEVGAQQELRVNPMGTYRGDIPYADVGRAWA